MPVVEGRVRGGVQANGANLGTHKIVLGRILDFGREIYGKLMVFVEKFWKNNGFLAKLLKNENFGKYFGV